MGMVVGVVVGFAWHSWVHKKNVNGTVGMGMSNKMTPLLWWKPANAMFADDM